jgi:hypothetical protein
MDILNNIRYGVELERAQMPDNGLNESPGLLNSILGTISGASQEGVDNKRNAIKNNRVIHVKSLDSSPVKFFLME